MDIGAQLRASREAAGLSLDRLANRTRVQSRFLAAIERNDLGAMPPPPFARGFVRAYAREVGLAPEETTQRFFAQFPGTPDADPVLDASRVPERRRARNPAWDWAVVAALAVLLVAASGSFTGKSAPGPSQPPIVGTSGTDTKLPVADRGTAEVTPAADAPLHAPGPALTVTIAADAECWVTATADGERVLYRLLPAGSRETLRAERELIILAGDASAASLIVNGRETGPLGPAGKVRSIRITPENAASVKTFRSRSN